MSNVLGCSVKIELIDLGTGEDTPHKSCHSFTSYLTSCSSRDHIMRLISLVVEFIFFFKEE